MALVSLRLRRALTASSSLLRSYSSSFSATPSSSSSSVLQSHISSTRNALQNPRRIQSLYFHSSLPSSSSRSSFNDDDKISPDTILFEGCDYNHWLITMEFPKDPKPTPEEMVETYVQTLAKVVGSVEEAKKRMYACSTTTYNGFQAVMTEEMSEKFRGLPGVVFILPDSYIDPVNKEYGGDKYINGTIIPRPPPVQYGRSGGRYGDRNRNVDRPPRNDRPREPMQMQQGNQPYDRQGPMQGDGRNYAPQQNYAPGAPQQNYAPGAPPQNYGPRAPPQNYGPGAPQQNFGPGASQQNYGPGAPQQNFGRGAPQTNYPPQQNYAPQQSYAPPQNYGPGGQGERRDSVPSYQRDYNQGTQGNYPSQEARDPSQGYQRGYAPPEHRDRGAAPPAGGFGQGTESGYRQPGEAQRFPQGQRNDVYQEKGSYMPGDGQGRY